VRLRRSTEILQGWIAIEQAAMPGDLQHPDSRGEGELGGRLRENLARKPTR